MTERLQEGNKKKETVGKNETGRQQRASGGEKIGVVKNVLSSELDSKDMTKMPSQANIRGTSADFQYFF